MNKVECINDEMSGSSNLLVGERAILLETTIVGT